MADPSLEPVLKIEITEYGNVLGIDGMRAISTVCVVPALEAVVMKIAVVAIARFQYSGFRLMNFDGLATELTDLDDTRIEVGATGGTSMNAVVEEILIAMLVQLMIAFESVSVLLTNIFEAYRTGAQYLPVDEYFEEFHMRHDAAALKHEPLLSSGGCRCSERHGHHKRAQCAWQ